MTQRLLWFVVFAASATIINADHAKQPLEKVTESELQELNDLLKAGSELPDLEAIRPKLDSKSPIVKSLAVVILYRTDPKKHEEQLYQCFSIHDYVARSRGKYNMIKPEEFIAQAKKIEQQFPQITDNRLQLLLMFHYYRDRNEWTGEGKKRLSPARIFRGAFLAIMCKDTQIDTEKITNEIDRRASKEDLKETSNGPNSTGRGTN